MTRWFRRWLIKQRKMKHTLRGTYVYRILGERIFDYHIWNHDINSVARGLSLGLFIAFTPTIPFQMLLCALGAILLRVSLPVSLVACWITNPLTALPIYLSARRLGQYLLENSQLVELTLDFFDFESRTGRFMEQGLYLWAGSLIFSVVSAFLGNVAARLVWRLGHRLKAKLLGGNENESR